VLLSDAKEMLRLLEASPAEVASIFSCKLDHLYELSSELDYSYQDVAWLEGRMYRLHCLKHQGYSSPITGLTFDILSVVSELALGTAASYYVPAIDQMSNEEMIACVSQDRAGQCGDTRSIVKRGNVTNDEISR